MGETGRFHRTGTGLSWLALFASAGTLICCALPIVLVSLGFGAAVAALTSNFPLLVSLSKHKEWIFLLSGAVLVLAAWLNARLRGDCPNDSALRALCVRTQRRRGRLFWASAIIWTVGFFAAYFTLPLRVWLES